MKYVLLLLVTIGTDDPDGGVEHAWALDGGMTLIECIARADELQPAYSLMGEVTLACEADQAPDSWN